MAQAETAGVAAAVTGVVEGADDQAAGGREQGVERDHCYTVGADPVITRLVY